MSDEGVFAVHRSVFSHPILVGEPYTRVQAWLWLLANAVWKPTRVRVKDSLLTLERGQCAYSLRFMAVHWKWSKNRVSAFLATLKDEQMIGTLAGRDATLITICNYDQYQFSPGHRKDEERDADGTQTGRRRDKEEELNKEIIEDIVRPAPNAGELFAIPAAPKKASGADPSFAEFYSAYPRKQSKQDAIKAYAAARKAGVPHETIMAGLERAKRSDKRFREAQFTPLPASWLRAGGFDDETAAQSNDWKQAVFG